MWQKIHKYQSLGGRFKSKRKMNMEPARLGKSRKKSSHGLSVWEIEESLNYDLLSDELLDILYSAQEEQRRELLTKISRGQYTRVKPASKKSRRSSRTHGQKSEGYSEEDFDTDELESDDWDE